MELGFVDKESRFVDQVFSWSVSNVLDHFDHSLILNKTLDEVGVSCKSSEQHDCLGKLYGPFCFINITEGREEVDDETCEIRNFVEVALVIKIVQRLYEEWRCCSQPLHVAVISPYAAQAAEIERRVGETYGYLNNFVLKVKTIEEFQNDGADIVILSTVKSNSTESIDFTSDFRKTNALFSKARHCVWILGSANALSKANPLWETVIANAEVLQCFVNANKDEEMAQIIANVKRQLDELEDLLDMKSLIFKDARWKVMFSESFVNSFSKLCSTYSKKVVLNFLLKLANGWRPTKYKADAISSSSMTIVKQYKVEGRYIICTKDICQQSGYAVQILKVWDILQLLDVPPLVKKLEKLYHTFSADYLRHCKDKSLEGNLEVPTRYSSFNISRVNSIQKSDSTNKFYGTSYTENSKVKESLLLMKFYSFSAGVVSHLLSAHDGTPMNDPFEVTDQEREIILHQGSSFILGRSGTGKTTVLVMKLFRRDQLHHMASVGFSEMNSYDFMSYPSLCDMNTTRTSLRQLFVTVNPKLCIAVKQHISNFQRFACGGTFGEQNITVNVNDLDEDENFKDIPSSFIDTPLKSYPLVVTFSMFVLMLDRTIGTSYFNRFPDIRKLTSQGIPHSKLLHQNLMKRREVTFEKFRESYWPHFNMRLTHKLDPSRIFTEIETHIKGSLHFGKAGEAKRSLKRYIHLSYKKGSNFDTVERNQIYEIFLEYEKMKLTRGEYDLADLVTDIYLRLKHEKYEGDLMDFVYVDEVQDMTVKQLVILKYISKNVREGFVFAGDTAQTIARGVHFRFEDVKCLFYKKFLHEESKEHNWKLSPLFNLTQNFRTHAGVLNLAQSITELIYHFFPESIDKLDPETSLVYGEPPVLLDSGLHGAMSVIFGDHGNDNENLISFGSDQVILVRDDCVKDEITKCIGKRAIVLTIFECKGLEFEDVLLYNFFGTSPLEDQWRIIYEYMDANLLLPANEESLPKFSHAKHNVLCYELKQLYVAITRTKQRLWICEESGGFPLPMVRYWQMLNTIQVKTLDDSYAREMPVISSLYDWKVQGLKMLEVRNYKIAAQCFENAGERDWRTYARASELKEAAHNVRSLRLDKSRRMLEDAAELFGSILKRKEAAECYFDAEHYKIAGSYYEEFDYQQAGQCFALAGCFEEAAKNYARANLLDECLHACSKGKLFELGLQYIQRWRGKFNYLIQVARMDINATEQKFLRKCANASYNEQDRESMMRYVKRFSSLKEMQSFLQKLNCMNELLELLVDFGEFVDAAKLARKMGNIVREAELLDKGHHYHDASLLYLASLLAGSLWADDGEGWPLKSFTSKEELSLKAKASASKYMPNFHAIVCSNIQLLSSDKYDFHDMKKQLALSRKNRDLMGEILAVRKILDILLSESKRSDPKNKVPITTLFWHWNLWKDNIVKILSYLESLKGKEPAECTEYGEFCLGYLGLRKRSDDPNEGYFMLYPNARWVKTVTGRADKKDSLNVWELVSAGERYWCSEILSVGIKVLKTLESVQKPDSTVFVPRYCKTRVPIQIFEFAASLMTHGRYLEQTYLDWHSLMSYIDLSADEYFRSDFSMDSKMLKTKDSIALTVSSRNIWKQAIFERFGSLGSKKPTLAQVTQVVVALLGTGRQKEVSSEFQIGSPWQVFLDDTVQGVDKVCHFHDALSDLYKAKSDISPSCFVYLLDRLLVMVSCFGECLFATRSSVIEWLIHLHWKVNQETFLLGPAETSSVTSIYDFLAYTVHELLINWQETEEWVKKTRPKPGQAQPTITSSLQLLNLKLVILLSLICLNTNRYLGLLNDVLLRSDILARLPPKFRYVIVERRGSSFRCAIAEALNRIDDCLVVVMNPEIDFKKMYIRHAVFLREFWSKDKILRDLRIML